MQWINLIPLAILLNPSTVSALSAARIWTNFYPSCPADHNDGGSTMHLNEQFTTAVDIKANVCQEIPVPLSFAAEVDHVSIDADLFWRDPLDQCRIKVHELPGCGQAPLLDEELKHGQTVSSCRARQFAFTQIWLELTCTNAWGIRAPVPLDTVAHGPNVPGNSTVPHNGTVASKRMLLSRRAWRPIL
ncbi:hypothetical protein ATEIFO6365_0003056500 [Aspergillus terreus]|uniref:Uncharacterized protein n=1 Tax=Aspergillus terreus TaxID=33178 RepID=A0A5M3YVV2_ASPTE|nr:hypothetical protein ATETN484_0003051000 [Aspergillus terreus]GFF14499.1 hypothetical protein ATEIFO6365_0003056500 [Aspergillus terreus]